MGAFSWAGGLVLSFFFFSFSHAYIIFRRKLKINESIWELNIFGRCFYISRALFHKRKKKKWTVSLFHLVITCIYLQLTLIALPVSLPLSRSFQIDGKAIVSEKWLWWIIEILQMPVMCLLLPMMMMLMQIFIYKQRNKMTDTIGLTLQQSKQNNWRRKKPLKNRWRRCGQ